MSIEGTFLNSRNSCASARFQSDGRKRASILEAARRVFLDRGFAAASMNEIVRESGISKATIYNHFTNKLALFEGVIRLEYSNVAEQRLEYDNNAWDVGAVLHQVGMSFMTRMVQPDHIRLLRIVIATSERFPEIGRVFSNRDRAAERRALRASSGNRCSEVNSKSSTSTSPQLNFLICISAIS
ncbi:TetR/AcrR family transcriptional regulator [Xanthobacter dioxanivorans]|uniref:TetR/AcrR family transcriptional regulator n=1 Tax=Xanthobacter dioxanivorans TaxID=2528964 RepID=A0A974SJ75_9HYPH|nr:TetR/AcrR family transcriptional regulator [Xanthobacter dioxanivorans]QRG07222.1 TetR/AcrR family transcriptional regulator [Xanthobacter dioxanivorans]